MSVHSRAIEQLNESQRLQIAATGFQLDDYRREGDELTIAFRIRRLGYVLAVKQVEPIWYLACLTCGKRLAGGDSSIERQWTGVHSSEETALKLGIELARAYERENP